MSPPKCTLLFLSYLKTKRPKIVNNLNASPKCILVYLCYLKTKNTKIVNNRKQCPHQIAH